MKKYITYFLILALGLVLGKLFFSTQEEAKTNAEHVHQNEKSQEWTCSMHPQIRQPEPGSCPICGMDLIPAQLGNDTGLMGSEAFKLSETALALADVQTTVVGSTNGSGRQTTLTGKIVLDQESNQVQVSYFSGRVERLKINAIGVEVKKGQLLAELYSPELYAAQQELITAASLKESKPELYQAVRNKLKLWKLTETQIEAIEKEGKPKAYFSVYATVSGTVVDKMVEQGDRVTAGQALLKIADLSKVWANFDLYEDQIDEFKEGQAVEVKVSAIPNVKYEAKVSLIEPLLNASTRTVNMRVVLDNKDLRLKPGMFVSGLFETEVKGKEEALFIPSSAVMWTGKRSIVYVKDPKDSGTFQLREVEVGRKTDRGYQVKKGLKEGETIVTSGTFTVDAAAQLQGKRSMMSPEAGADRMEVPGEFQEQLKRVYTAYLELKDALTRDDPDAAKAGATLLAQHLKEVDMTLLKEESEHMKWMKISKALSADLKSFAKTDDLGEQRMHFMDLSNQMTEAIKTYGVGETVYHQFCPMANNDQGAYWLSQDEEVRNPYFGKSMHSCGLTKTILE